MTADPEKPAGAPIRIRYVECADYFVEASEQLPSKPISINRWQIGFVIVAVILLPILMMLRRRTSELKAWAIAITLVLPLILIGFAVLFIFLFRKPKLLFGRNYYRKAYRKQIGRDETNAVAEFGQEALFISGESGVATHIPWHTIPRVVERPKGLFVYESDTIFRWFPKSAFASETDYAAAIELMRSKVSRFEHIV